MAISSLGPKRGPLKGVREQPFWDEHAAFVDQLVAEGFISIGGPLFDHDELPAGALFNRQRQR